MVKFQAEKFLMSGYLNDKKFRLQFLKVISYMRVLTVSFQFLTSCTKFELNSLKNNEITNYRHFWLSRHSESQNGRHI